MRPSVAPDGRPGHEREHRRGARAAHAVAPVAAEGPFADERRCGGAAAPHTDSAFPSGRDPEATLLHQVVRAQLSSLLADAEDRGGLTRFVERDFSRYLACGVLAHGFARLA